MAPVVSSVIPGEVVSRQGGDSSVGSEGARRAVRGSALRRLLPRPWEVVGHQGRIRPLTESIAAIQGSDRFGANVAAAPRAVLWSVAFAALATNVLSLAAAQLWIYPDSIDYLELAGRIVNGFDLGDELYLIRTPAYPFLLAAVFRVFGSWSPEALLVLQHGMAIGVAVLTSAIAWHLTHRRAAALVCGWLVAGSLQVLAYANLMLTETAFTLVLTACVYFLIQFEKTGRYRALAIASALCGMAYLLRPIGLCLVVPCVLAGWLGRSRVWTPPFARGGAAVGALRPAIRWALVRARRWTLTGTLASVGVAVLPAMVAAGPWMVYSRSAHHGAQASRCLDYVLYLRAASFDGLDSTQSRALREIKSALSDAQAGGVAPSTATYRDRPAVEHALRAARGMSFGELSALMGEAGRDLMREHPWPTFVNTFRYAAWMVLEADPVYRFVPGGEPGRGGGRAKGAELFDIGTYSVGEGSWEKRLQRFAAYAPLETHPRACTPLWAAIVRWSHRAFESGAAGTSAVQSPFAWFMLFCGAGGVAMLFSARRSAWAVVLVVIAVHVLASAFLAGPLTRYAVSVKPLLLMCGGAALAWCASSLALAVRLALRVPFRFFQVDARAV